MPFEHRSQPLIPFARFVLRLARVVATAASIVLFALGIGVVGYRVTEGMPWIDALLNASMILSGMGPVDALHSNAGKLFASCYSIFSGVAFLTIAAVLFGPVIHRMLHRFHLDEQFLKEDE